MSSTDPIVAAARRLVRTLLKNTDHCPDIEFVGVRSFKTGCDHIATPEGFDVRIDRQPTAGEIVARVYHAAAHMLCLQYGIQGHSGSGHHNANFELALEQLGAPANAPEEEILSKLNKSQKLALDAFMSELKKIERTRSTKDRTSYQRTTVYCEESTCKHQLTVRSSAVAKTRFLCVTHGEEMTARNE